MAKKTTVEKKELKEKIGNLVEYIQNYIGNGVCTVKEPFVRNAMGKYFVPATNFSDVVDALEDAGVIVELVRHSEYIKDEANEGYQEDMASQILRGLKVEDRPLLTEDEERKLAERRDAGDPTAINEMIEHNYRLVVYIAKRYVNTTGVTINSFEDLFQEGVLGLMNACQRFDPDKARFSTYATWWIRQAICRYICNTGNTIRKPVHVVEHWRRLNNFRRDYYNENGYYPSEKEMSDALGVSIDKVKELMEYTQNSIMISLDTPLNEDDPENTIGDTYVKADAVAIEDEVLTEVLREDVRRVMAEKLSQREYEVVCLRFGIPDGAPHTLEEVGKKYGVTRERIRQIESKALKKLFCATDLRHYARLGIK